MASDFTVSKHINGYQWVATDEGGVDEKVSDTKKEAVKNATGMAQSKADETGESQRVHIWNGDGSDYKVRIIEPGGI